MDSRPQGIVFVDCVIVSSKNNLFRSGNFQFVGTRFRLVLPFSAMVVCHAHDASSIR